MRESINRIVTALAIGVITVAAGAVHAQSTSQAPAPNAAAPAVRAVYDAALRDLPFPPPPVYFAHRPKRPVVAVIYTHSHSDHYGGVRGVVDSGDVSSLRCSTASTPGSRSSSRAGLSR